MNPDHNVYEHHCVDQDGRRRAGFWTIKNGADMMGATKENGLRDWRKLTALPKDIVPVNDSDGISVWEPMTEPNWIARNTQRFAGLWQQPPDADFLYANSTV